MDKEAIINMKKKKLLFMTLLASSFLALTSCSLFNDDDIKIHNSYNPPANTSSEFDPDGVYANGVKGKRIEEVQNAYCFKNVGYDTNGKIANTYKSGAVNENEFNVNQGEDYSADKNSNNYDLYIPDSVSKNDKHLLLLFIHGGAWVSGFKTDVNPYVYEFANKGYITATIKYTLMNREMNDNTLSLFRDLDEIDACIKSIKNVLGNLGYDTSKTNLAIGGASSGAHLAMLYAYSRGVNCSLPIKFVVNAVGPVDIKPENWKSFADASDANSDDALTYASIEAKRAASKLNDLGIAGESNDWNAYQTMRIANGMCGIPYSLADIASSSSDQVNIDNPNAASNAMTKVNGGEDQLSVTHYISASNKIPMICAYGGQDSVVGIAQYAKLENALNTYGVEKYFVYFKDSDHIEITDKKNHTAYQDFVNKISEWCESKNN